MTHEDVRLHLAEDAGLRLLQSGNAPLVLSFLHAQFKAKPRVTIPHAELAERLEAHLLALREREPDAYPSAAPAYLSAWCDEQHRFLRKYFETGRDEPVYELTPATERVLRWIGELDQTAFVGTESRFLAIFNLLRDIVQKGTEDLDVRLERLEEEKAALEAEIAELRSTGLVERYEAGKTRELFLRASDEARRLLADFRQVEANFRDVTRRVQERRLLDEATKGDLVGYVIDEDDALKASDQGRSFYAFWRFLISRAKKEEWQGLLEAAYALPEVEALARDHDLLRHIVCHLSEAGQKVVQSNRRLAEQLRRMLDELPIPVHTKFVEAHAGILGRLLDVVLPEADVRQGEKDFHRRFGLRYDEPLVRARLLDVRLQARYGVPVADLSTPVSEFRRLAWRGARGLIVENKWTFLTLPPHPNGFALWGGGFGVGVLREVEWLADVPLLYWGDLDAQGFMILSQLRSFLPHARSFLMDGATLDAFRAFVVPGTPLPETDVRALPHLTPAEQALFRRLAEENLRLEQERIPPAFVQKALEGFWIDE